MKTWGVIVCLVAVAGAQVYAGEAFAFVEDVASPSSTRIVSGWEAEEGQIPWQLSLRMVDPAGGVSSCGGSIIHSEWGMTAAHCTAARVTMVLRGGAVSLTRPELLFETTEYYNHPLYNNQLPTVVQPHDISLLKFPLSITFSDRVQPIRVQREADMNRNYADVRLEASGWGRTWTNGAAPDALQWVYLVGNTNLACWLAFGGSSIIVDSTICASHYNVTSQSTCQGDSGGPLVELAEEDGLYTMVGVASFVSGTGCHTGFPAGFIRPGHYHNWMREVTGIDFDWDYEISTTTEAVTTEGATTEDATTEAATTEAATTEAATTEAATTEAATTEAATTEAATTEAATTEAATTEAATTEAATTEAATTEAATTEAATTEAATTEAATTEAATTEAATTEAATTEAATTEAATTEAATTEAATTEAATTEAATTEAATTEAATTEAATTEAATTEAATTEAATTEAATTEAATTEAATTEAATTEAATTEAATTEAASTEAETTEAATTEAATTEAATTEAATTDAATTEAATTEAATTEAATTEAATTEAPEESRFIFSFLRSAFARM